MIKYGEHLARRRKRRRRPPRWRGPMTLPRIANSLKPWNMDCLALGHDTPLVRHRPRSHVAGGVQRQTTRVANSARRRSSMSDNSCRGRGESSLWRGESRCAARASAAVVRGALGPMGEPVGSDLRVLPHDSGRSSMAAGVDRSPRSSLRTAWPGGWAPGCPRRGARRRCRRRRRSLWLAGVRSARNAAPARRYRCLSAGLPGHNRLVATRHQRVVLLLEGRDHVEVLAGPRRSGARCRHPIPPRPRAAHPGGAPGPSRRTTTGPGPGPHGDTPPGRGSAARGRRSPWRAACTPRRSSTAPPTPRHLQRHHHGVVAASSSNRWRGP